MAPRLVHYSDVENVYDTPERAGRLAGLLEDLDGEDALLAGSGDDTSPGVLALVEDGAQALDFFDAVEPDVETFGNHEFDHGLAALRDLVADSPQTWVSANVWADRDADERFAADAGVVPATVLEADGATVGVVGVTTERTGSINPEATAVEFADPIEAARDALADLDADYRVVLSHLGRRDEELARAVDADAILGGHVPTERRDRIDGTLLTRPGDGGSVVLEIDLATGEVTRHSVADAPLHEGVADAMRTRLAETGLNEVVGTVEEPIDRAETTLFGGESRLGNLVADAYRQETGADVGLQNSGGVRTGDPLEGEITAADLVSVTPFEERVVVAEVPGDALREAFEWAASPDLGFAESGWWHAQISGATVAWDPDAHRVESVEVGGEPVADDRSYTVALSDYVLHTDDEFPSLRESQRVERWGIQYEVLVEYARETGVAPEIEGRIAEVSDAERPEVTER
ncbi:5'-nucleotidase C-terminal domain-containing protein [Halorussus gelatinilyticus]|uniref:5'-nucleotidase C-terminal domain-containing protein n=1 Tax=Halorussus gelatinilyticus TaxID=2937524 RepID=A0A8U0IH99_9EURY|nr:5'-nucleotidase C-terminal domain-containing protein [Halorussus gelatinilyticus]UPW00353.1 5'-nucleotidase C-terminal domain-containing protein [Halorussus gelatinilyticus]